MAESQSGYGAAYTQGTGTFSVNDFIPIVANRTPTSSDVDYPIGKIWSYPAGDEAWILLSKSSAGGVLSADWVDFVVTSGNLSTLTGDSGTATPSSNNILIAGGSNVTTSASGSTLTVDLDATVSGLTSITATTINTSPLTANLSISGSAIAATGTNANIPINITPKGASLLTVSYPTVGGTGGISVENTDTGVTSNSRISISCPVGAGDPYMLFSTSGGGNSWSIGIDNSASDVFVIRNDSAIGAPYALSFALTTQNATFGGSVSSAGYTATSGNIAASAGTVSASTTVTGGTGLIATTGGVTATAGDITANGGDIITTRSAAGADVTVEATNSDNTSGTSRGGFEAAVGGTSSGDPYVNWLISGGQTFTMGIDNSTANDDLVISQNAALGTNNVIVFNSSTPAITIPTYALIVTAGNFAVDVGDATVGGNLIMSGAAKQIQMNGGAVTDFIGQATLVAGTVTVANTNIGATDRIFIQRNSVNGSTATGNLVYAITPATSFSITSTQPGTPAATETNDVSIVDYVIIRQF